MTTRHLVLGGLLLVTLAAAFWPTDPLEQAGDGNVGVVEAVNRDRQVHRALAAQDGLPLTTESTVLPSDARQARLAAALQADLFPAQSFRPPPPPPPKPAAPPPPMSPTLPFTFVGAWLENGRQTVFLEQGAMLLSVHVGDRLPGGWRLDAHTPESLTFTYVSLNQQSTLRIAP